MGNKFSLQESGLSSGSRGNSSGFVVPGYGKDTLAELLPSVIAAINPGAPEAPSIPYINYFNFPRARHAIVILLDGLGLHQLRQYAGHAPFLAQAAEASVAAHGTLTSTFPSTTATSLASLATGLPPAQHGVVGYEVLNPDTRQVMNHLSRWTEEVDPYQWQANPTLFERLCPAVAVATASYPKFEHTPTTRAILRGSSFLGAQDFKARTDLALDFIAGQRIQKRQALVYLYSDQPDYSGHRHGVGSAQWVSQLEDAEANIRYLVRKKHSDTLGVLISDHGMVTVASENRIDFSSEQDLMENIALSAGEPRCVYLYVKDPSAAAIARTQQAWLKKYGGKAWILSKNEAVGKGLFGGGQWGKEMTVDAAARIGDIIVMAKEQWVFYNSAQTGISIMESKVVGQHGSMTPAETQIPLIVL